MKKELKLLLAQKEKHAYFKELGKYIAETTKSQFTFISKIENYTNAIPMIALDGIIEMENVKGYDTRTTPCFVVTESCAGYYPSNVQTLFPNDHYFKENDIIGYIGVSVVPENQVRPVAIINCLYKTPPENPEEYISFLKEISESIKNDVEMILS